MDLFAILPVSPLSKVSLSFKLNQIGNLIIFNTSWLSLLQAGLCSVCINLVAVHNSTIYKEETGEKLKHKKVEVESGFEPQWTALGPLPIVSHCLYDIYVL